MPRFTPNRWTQLHGCGIATGFSPPDSSSIYFARWNIFDPSTSYTTHAFEVQTACVITGIHCLVIITTNSGNPASNVTLHVRVNDTTDYAVGSGVAWSTPGVSYSDTGLSIPLAAGDDFVYKFATANWTVTNPSACFVSLIANFRQP